MPAVRGMAREEKMAEHFCTCPKTDCPRHPQNHSAGCNPCVQHNLGKRNMPACFFKAVHLQIDGLADYSIKGFVDFYHRHTPACK